jgi:ABC-type dipeptide/oligopeptide/nickel transport system ATPase component
MVFQDPLSSLNPVRRVGDQIAWVIRRHTGADRREAERQTLDLVRQMKLPRPEQIVRAYPHEISGGQRQRIMIAMALACYPQLIIADEPTTALDVTVQKQVLRLLNAAVRERNSALLMITHDLPIIAAMCDTVAVMYAGRIVEMGPVGEVFRTPRHHYTRGLLESQPTMDNIALDGSSRLVSIPGMVPPLHRPAHRLRLPSALSGGDRRLPRRDAGTGRGRPQRGLLASRRRCRRGGANERRDADPSRSRP